MVRWIQLGQNDPAHCGWITGGIDAIEREAPLMASEGFHEPIELLDEATLDYHRAMTSLCEELDAIDWYDQRVKATADASLAAILAYNRDDEKEHASMLLEWLRRRDPALDENLRKFLFTSEPITEIGVATESSAPLTLAMSLVLMARGHWASAA
jgi:ferritin-like protein